MRRLILILSALFMAQPALAASPFASWAAVVVAGDWQRRQGVSSWAYDNARRDVGKALVSVGFSPANIRQFSAQPEWFPAEQPPLAEVGHVRRALSDMVKEGHTGCLLYITTHGRKDGSIWFGRQWVSPDEVRSMLDEACGENPAIVVISACYSGAFIPALHAPQRYVLTAARADRQSFLCGAENYPHFDACFLGSLPGARDFLVLAQAVQACVASREREAHIAPPSEPQVSIGDVIAPLLRQAAFEH